MRTRYLALAVAIVLAGCDGVITYEPPNKPNKPCPDGVCPDEGKCPFALVPPMDLPIDLRQRNYNGGSCFHAGTISVLRHQNLHTVADHWRANFGGGASVNRIAGVADSLGLRYAYTNIGDPEFLEWCSRTRRGASIAYYSNHAITFCGYVEGNAILMDNNRVEKEIKVPKATFLRNWRGYGGQAFTVVYSPNPPRPWRG